MQNLQAAARSIHAKERSRFRSPTAHLVQTHCLPVVSTGRENREQEGLGVKIRVKIRYLLTSSVSLVKIL